MIPVSHYGLHWAEGGVAFLHQRFKAENALGLPIESPFEVQTKKPCNHNILLNIEMPIIEHMDRFLSIHDVLINAMLPVPSAPGSSALWLSDSDSAILKPRLVCLSKLSSPIRPIVIPFWMMSPDQVVEELSLTNLQPLVLTDITSSLQMQFDKVCQYIPFAVRRLIFMGSSEMIMRSNILPVQTKLNDYNLEDLITLPWEQIGAWTLRKHMLK